MPGGKRVAAILVTGALLVVPVATVDAAPRGAQEPAPATGCDPLDARKCLFPFPNDYFTVDDLSTDTGRRVAFGADAMPANVQGVHVDPTEWNRNDGFSPGSTILTFVEGLDLEQTGAAPSTDIARSLRKDAPIVLLDTETGKRVPYWAELDASVSSDDLRSLIVRPAVHFGEGHRIVVALRNLKDADGTTIEPGEQFLVYRDKVDVGFHDERRDHMESIFKTLDKAGIERDDLHLAWDFTVASERSLSERMLHIRDDAFESLQGDSPAFAVDQVQEGGEDGDDPRIARRVTGQFDVRSYLTGDGGPGERFSYEADAGPDALPKRNGDIRASFICNIPRTALADDGTVRPGMPVVYGHGLLGSADEVDAGNIIDMIDEHGYVYCATNWIGMAEEDIGNAARILQDFTGFPTLADRVQQGILNTLFLARMLVHPDGLRSDPAFQGKGGKPVIRGDEAFFDSNSQGAIIGGAATAVAQDWKQAVLGVAGMNYSTLLQRSSDFDTYEAILDPAYPDEIDRTLGITLAQMLWDRAETNGYAAHATDDPYAKTPAHRILLHEAFGDHQVANVALDVEARTMGAHAHLPALAKGRSDDRTPLWGIEGIGRYPYAGSALVVWDSGTPAPPAVNLPPSDGKDPHEDPRAQRPARRQKAAFLRPAGKVIDVCAGKPCTAHPVE